MILICFSQMKYLTDMNCQEVILDYLMILLQNGQMENAKEVIQVDFDVYVCIDGKQKVVNKTMFSCLLRLKPIYRIKP